MERPIAQTLGTANVAAATVDVTESLVGWASFDDPLPWYRAAIDVCRARGLGDQQESEKARLRAARGPFAAQK